MNSPFYARRQYLQWAVGCLGAATVAMIIAIVIALATGIISFGPRPGPAPTAVAAAVAATSPAAVPPVQQPTPATPGSGGARNLGLVGVDLAAPPAAAGPAETLVLHGDVDHTGRCSVRVFGPNQRVVAERGGIYRVVSLPGTPEENGNAIRRIQAAAARDAGTDCPLR